MMRSATAAATLALTLSSLGSTGARAATPTPQIVFTRQLPDGGAKVFVANADGSQQLEVPLPDLAEDFAVPRWSPDRQHLLVSTMLRPGNDGNLLPFRPAVVNPDGTNYRLLQPPGAPDSMGCFGGWLAAGSRLLCNFNGAVPGVFSHQGLRRGRPDAADDLPLRG